MSSCAARRAAFLIAAAAAVAGAVGCGGASSTGAGSGGPTAPASSTTTPPSTTGPVTSTPEPSPEAAPPPTTVPSPPPGACAGLVPSPGSPVEVAQDISAIPNCFPGVGTGDGTALALGVGLHIPGYTAYPMSGGTAEGSFQAGFQDAGASIVPSHTGFHVIEHIGYANPYDVGNFVAYDAHGHAIGAAAGLTGSPRSIRADPTSGSVLLTLSDVASASPSYHVEYMDDRGVRRAHAALDRPAFVLGVATNGKVLVLSADAGPTTTRILARWFDREANALTAWFDTGRTLPRTAGAPGNLLQPIAGGDMVLRVGGDWVARFPAGTERVDDAPAWLRSRPNTNVSPVRGALANAVTWAGGNLGTCDPAAGQASLEILTSDGTSCGTVSLPQPAQTCGFVSFGRDGTVLTLASEGSPSAAGQRCTWRWWPALLR